MAIKISGTTVIDDSRNISNIGVATATTFSGNLMTGNATGSFWYTKLKCWCCYCYKF
jgi:hypothetical protein